MGLMVEEIHELGDLGPSGRLGGKVRGLITHGAISDLHEEDKVDQQVTAAA